MRYRPSMSSNALADWRGPRSSGLDALVQAHLAVTGGVRGRPAFTKELNHALIARLASQLQGFSRDLHDEVIDCLLTGATVPDAAIRQVFRTRLEDGRFVDKGNANPGNLGTDFLRLGITLWPDIYAAYPFKGPHWNKELDWLNLARNGIAHNDVVKITAARGVHPLTLATFKRVRGVLGQFCAGMDVVVGTYLKAVTGVTPW